MIMVTIMKRGRGRGGRGDGGGVNVHRDHKAYKGRREAVVGGGGAG